MKCENLKKSAKIYSAGANRRTYISDSDSTDTGSYRHILDTHKAELECMSRFT
jgi:hypothetical protein